MFCNYIKMYVIIVNDQIHQFVIFQINYNTMCNYNFQVQF